eukprot:1007746-Rhodomonas_salina.1
MAGAKNARPVRSTFLDGSSSSLSAFHVALSCARSVRSRSRCEGRERRRSSRGWKTIRGRRSRTPLCAEPCHGKPVSPPSLFSRCLWDCLPREDPTLHDMMPAKKPTCPGSTAAPHAAKLNPCAAHLPALCLPVLAPVLVASVLLAPGPQHPLLARPFSLSF